MPRPFTKRVRTRSIPVVVVLVLAGLLAARVLTPWFAPGTAESDLPLQEGPCHLVRVVNGHTLVVRQWVQPAEDQPRVAVTRSLRLLGIQAPLAVAPDRRVEPFGPEAAEFTRQFVRQGELHLQLDRRRIDRYDRMLGYLYVNDQMLNEEIVRAGLARVRVFPGDSQVIERRLRAAEQEARTAQRGIWALEDD